MNMSAVLKDHLARVVPAWGRFNILPCAKYLGIWLGPKAGTKQWHEQADKWRTRARAISEMNLSGVPTALLYNCRAITVLSYAAQFNPPKVRLMCLRNC